MWSHPTAVVLLSVCIAIKNNGGSTFVSGKDGDALVSFEGGHSPSLEGGYAE